MNEDSQSDSPKDPESEASETLVVGETDHDEASSIAGETVIQVGSAGPPSISPATTHDKSTGKSAFMVAAGILISRIIGLIRQRVFAHYFGLSDAGDAFNVAFKIPNFLQNVFGEGALSASFIPVYAKLLAKDDQEEASHVANAVLTLLALATSVIVLLGVLTTPYFIDLIAAGFTGPKRELTITLVKIFFPGAGLLVLSAWCLGVLNSHRKFFLSYTAPVLWNLAIIGALVGFGGRVGEFRLAEIVAWASVAGSALQLAVQVPTVLGLLKRFRPVFDVATAEVRSVVRNFFPVFISRGVIQISAFVDTWLATWLGTGAVGALSYTQSIYTLPVSLFGMAVSAAELPAMAGTIGTIDEVAAILRHRLDAGLQRIAFFIVPSAMAFLALGDVMAGALYQTGKFKQDGAIYVWAILAGSSIGLLAATLGRLYSSTYYALRDTRTPLLYAIIHVALATCLGYLCAFPVTRYIGLEPKWGVVGLTMAATEYFMPFAGSAFIGGVSACIGGRALAPARDKVST